MADIVFLDVEMPGKSGIEVGRSIKEKNPYALIFIVSFTEQYLDDAMDFQVFRYIEKASLPDRIERNLRDALVAYRNTNPKITIMKNGETIVCREADIVMIENQRRCVYVCTKDAKYEVKGKLMIGSKTESGKILQISYEFSGKSGLCEPVYKE